MGSKGIDEQRDRGNVRGRPIVPGSVLMLSILLSARYSVMFDLIRSDGHLAESEARLFWRALDTWRLRLEDGIEYGLRAAAFRQRGRQRQAEFNAMPSRDRA